MSESNLALVTQPSPGENGDSALSRSPFSPWLAGVTKADGSTTHKGMLAVYHSPKKSSFCPDSTFIKRNMDSSERGNSNSQIFILTRRNDRRKKKNQNISTIPLTVQQKNLNIQLDAIFLKTIFLTKERNKKKNDTNLN